MIRVKLMLLTLLLATAIQRNETPKQEPQLMRVTCYTWTGNKTASGVYPEEGMCASNWSHMGDTAHLYDMDMNYIGSFVVTDTGGAKSLKNGTSIDLYKDTLARCYEHINEYGDYAYVIWEEGEE